MSGEQKTERKISKNAQAKVYVGLSGGVDSSVSAALLQRDGYDVTGVFIRVWQPDFIECDWKQDRRDAMRVCARLGIPFVELDLEKEYKSEVIDYMINEYCNGRTPNPDVMCNQHVKFGAFLDFAKEEGADFVATGHYVRREEEGGEVKLLVGEDENKDQSYFLWTLSQEKLSRVLFPVGEYKKDHVRKLAHQFELPTAEKKDSQGLCFVGKVEMRSFLQNFIKAKEGDVLNVASKVIGQHDGAFFYTVGQRHGFTITNKTPDDMPYYVVSKDVDENTITVSQQKKEEGAGAVSAVSLEKVNWISGDNAQERVRCKARFRYRQRLLDVVVKDGGKKVVFSEPQNSIAIGQSLVLYDGTECLGGGVISSVWNS